jgi:hypothetical protein
MAVEFFTGFEGCGVTADVLSFLSTGTTGTGYSATGGFNNGKCASLTGGSGVAYKYCTAAATVCVGFHISGRSTDTFSLATTFRGLVRFIVGAVVVTLTNTTDGISVHRDSTLLGTIGSGVVVDTALHHIEVKLLSHASAGTAEVKLDGVSVGALTGLNTTGTSITLISIGSGSTASKLDNFFIADDFVGEMRSILSSPTSDSSVQFTPSAGSNYQNVDDTAQDGDTTYNESSTVGHKDLFGFADIATSGIDVKCVSLVTVARKDDAGERTLTCIANQDATDYDQTTHTLATAYPATLGAVQSTILSTAPDTSAWTSAIFNAMLWGYKVAT